MKTLRLLALAFSVVSFCHADNFTLLDGTKYENVRVKRVEPDGIVIMTDAGIEKLPFEKLPSEVQASHGYNSTDAVAYKKQQQTIQAATSAKSEQERRVFDQQARQKTDDETKQDEMAAAVASIQSAKPEPGTIGKPGIHILKVSGKVLQVLPQGILLASDWRNETLERVGNHFGSIIMSEPLLVVGDMHGLVDGEPFSGVVFPAGTFAYTTVNGATKTIRCYATSADIAKQHLLKE